MRGGDWRALVEGTRLVRECGLVEDEPEAVEPITASPIPLETADALRRGEPTPAQITITTAPGPREEALADLAAAFNPELAFSPSTSAFLAEEILRAIEAGRVRHIHLDQ